MNTALESIFTEIHNENFHRIGFVGDSITSTEWVHPNWREIVEYVLKEELTSLIGNWKTPSWKIRCFNFGFDGSTTIDLLDLAKEITNHNLQTVFLMAGDNDAHQNIAPDIYIQNMHEIILSLKNSGVGNVYIVIPPPPNNENVSQAFDPYIEELLKLQNQEIIDLRNYFPKDLSRFYTFESIGDGAFKKGDIDYLHPNQLGNAYIAKGVLKEAFEIEFDPEKYIETTLSGKMYPEY